MLLRHRLANTSFVSLVDEEDYETVARFSWQMVTQCHCRYAYSKIAGPMHRLLLGFPKALIDHRNGNGLDNRRQNLRLCTHSQNLANSRKHVKSRSVFKGVSHDPRKSRAKPWRAEFRFLNRRYRSGHSTELEAALAYDKMAREIAGEFARTNFP